MQAAKEAVERETLCAAVVDYVLPDGTGFEVLDFIVTHMPSTPVIVLTAHASVQRAVEAMERGAFTYLEKPVDAEALLSQLKRAVETGELRREHRRRRRLRAPRHGAAAFLGESAPAKAVRDMVRRIAASPARSVSLEGESGVGKGLVARAIHEESDRGDGPFVSITCSAVPDHLLESELFGHEAGAFTDARKRKMGLLEAADGGTLFLDEIADMPALLQAKMLGVLEDRIVRPVGGLRSIRVDLRVVSATNQDLPKQVRDGAFREDLYYRLRVVPFSIPSLRERPEDVPLLAEHFARQVAAEWGRPPPEITAQAQTSLAKRRWPGNVRELRNAIERAVILSHGDQLGIEDFVDHSHEAHRPIGIPAEGLDVEKMIDQLVRQALERTDGNQSSAARLLCMSRDQIRYRMQKMGLLPGAGSERA